MQRFGSALNLNVHFHLLVLDGVRALERAGLITHDIDHTYLAFDPGEEPPLHALLGSSITYRIAAGPRDGQRVFTLQTLPAEPDAPRPEVATERLALTGSGHVRYTLKPPYRDGTTHVIFEPEDFIARLASLVPKPRAHLTRYQRLRRVFTIDIETCRQCGGRLRVIASIEQPAIIDRILAHLGRAAGAVDPAHPSGAPPGRPRLI